MSDRPVRVRREPPPLRPVAVVERVERSPRLLRLTLRGEGLHEMLPAEPAASVRLLVPSPGTRELVTPEWNGNEFLLPDGSRPALRTFTPLASAAGDDHLDLEIVRHPGGAVSDWAEAVGPGDAAALSGPGRGFELDPSVTRLIVLADETAMPAAGQLLEVVPDHVAMEVHVEVVLSEAEIELPRRRAATVRWHLTGEGRIPGRELVDVARGWESLPEGTHVWAAGEASAVQAVRTHLFDTLGEGRSRATVRGYWKPPR